MSVLAKLKSVKWSDNTCSVGWSNIHAYGWNVDSVAVALSLCPRGRFSYTSYVNSDMRRGFTPQQKDEVTKYGIPICILAKGSYFDFPLDDGALHLMQRLGLINELMVMRASGGRHKWPEDEDVPRLRTRSVPRFVRR